MKLDRREIGAALDAMRTHAEISEGQRRDIADSIDRGDAKPEQVDEYVQHHERQWMVHYTELLRFRPDANPEDAVARELVRLRRELSAAREVVDAVKRFDEGAPGQMAIQAYHKWKRNKPAEPTHAEPVYRCLGCDKGWRTATKDDVTWHYVPQRGQTVCVAHLAIDNDEPQPPALVHIPDDDIEWHAWPRQQGGQQTTPSPGVIAIHKPTGTAAACKDERSQLRNKQRAVTALRVLLTAPDRGTGGDTPGTLTAAELTALQEFTDNARSSAAFRYTQADVLSAIDKLLAANGGGT